MVGRRMALLCGVALAVGISGTGLAHAAPAAPTGRLAVAFDTSSLAAMYPGATRPVTYTVANPATDRSVTVQDAGTGPVQGTVSVDPEHAGCDAGWFSFTPQGHEAVSYAPGASSTYTGSLAMVNTDTNQNACQGATLSLTITVGA